ncbi:hypothetical protein [Deinococcus budaensis]|uniref:DUF2680 domain-containing protein n=1 Tax=Deinococcus budaensis TaxID=1665626 RepID=A0A7W8GCH4_9DEIO|nr:hypothetical protein [Deinococcus budaensis]MBB5232801.1 hypothetical protein [Deinococcus budaensis]
MTPHQKRSVLFALAALPLTAGLVLAAGTAAQPPQASPTQTQQAQPAQPGSGQTGQPRTQASGTNYAEVFFQKLAAQLGVSVERLRAAAVAAGGATLDQAVGAGDLSAQRAAAIKQRLEDAPLNFGFGRHGFGGPDRGRHDPGGRGGWGQMDGGPRGFGHPHVPNGAGGGDTSGVTSGDTAGT